MATRHSFARFALRRLALLVPQLFAVVTVAFVLIRIIPGDPAANFLGGNATTEAIHQLRVKFGLEASIPSQYIDFLRDLLHGDLGQSWRTSQAVTRDIGDRLPITLQLITGAMALSVLIAVPLGIAAGSLRQSRVARASRRITRGYGLIAGAMPEFWLGLLLILLFFVVLGVAPGPFGLLSSDTQPPTSITGFVVVDALLTANWAALSDALAHLALPVATLTFVTAAPLLRMTMSEMSRVLDSDFVRYARAMGMPERTVYRYALQSVSAPIITLAGILYAFLIGGAVLVEQIFSLGGFGQYGVGAVLASDYPALLGFVTVAGTFAFVTYLALDLLQAALDPRLR
jgi:ABC-type dipeptide/oligopeptide/nickel transport system permease component